MLTDEYIAGFFDGEGCVSIGTRGQCQVSITQKNPEVLYMIQEIHGGAVGCKERKFNNCYAWRQVSKEGVGKFLESILPHSVVKRKEIELGLEAVSRLRSGNNGCNPLTSQEMAVRESIRERMQLLRPKKTFCHMQSEEYRYRQSIKEKANWQCNLCGKNLKETRVRDQIVSQEKLWCRGCAASRTNKRPLKPISKERIEEVLGMCNSLDEACAILDIGRSALFQKRKEYGLPARISMRGKKRGTYIT